MGNIKTGAEIYIEVGEKTKDDKWISLSWISEQCIKIKQDMLAYSFLDADGSNDSVIELIDAMEIIEKFQKRIFKEGKNEQ